VGVVGTGAVLAGRYRLERRLGAGGYGEVWQGTDELLARPVAIKLLHEEFAAQPETLARFRAEAHYAGSVSHENIARIYDYDEPEPPGQPFLVMEYVDGPALAEVLRAGPVAPGRVLDVLDQAASGLHAAHLAGLVHRDIKPENILLGRGGIVKLTDFGISYAAGSAPVTGTGPVLGTSGYLAPERAAGARGTAASDLYALGVVAYLCLAGRPPFTGTPVQVAQAHRSQPLPPLPDEVPPEVAELVTALTAKDPAGRPASAAEVARMAGALRDRLAAGGAGPGQSASGPDAPAAFAGLAAGSGAASPEARSPGARPSGAESLGAGALGARSPGTRSSGAGSSGTGALGAGALGAGVASDWSAGSRGRAPGSDPPTVPQPRVSLRVPLSRRARRAVPFAAGAAVIAIGAWLFISVINPAVRAPDDAARASAVMVRVDTAELRGQLVSAVYRKLRREGLLVRVHWRVTSEQAPGRVVAIRPDGLVPAGSIVVIVGALEPGSAVPPAPGTSPSPDYYRPSPRPSSSSPRPTRTAHPSPSPTPTRTEPGTSTSPNPTPPPTPTPTSSSPPPSSPPPGGSPSPGATPSPGSS
jgi:eukaryotic-like serine/threonine-protein kinase